MLCVTLNVAAYTGKIYVDTNKNGIYDNGEQKLEGVLVSNGLDVVKTNTKGIYTLPEYPKGKFIFITTPSGFQTNNGHFQRIELGKKEYNFGLSPTSGYIAHDGAHNFLHITDTEISSPVGQDGWLNNVRDYAHNEQSAFIIHTGDICYEDGLKSHLNMMNANNMGVPVFYCIGNHDLVKGKYGEEMYESIYGPVYYSFDVGNVHYVVTPMLRGDYRPGYRQKDVCRWLKNDLTQIPSGTPVIVFNHDILTTSLDFVYGTGEEDAIPLDNYNLKAWIYGHLHINQIRKHGQAYSICTSTPTCGGIGHAAAAFRVMKIDRKGDWQSELRYTYIDKKLQIASIQNGKAALAVSGKVPLSVNAYTTVSPTVQVEYSCWADKKIFLCRKKMVQQTDFNWYDEFVIPNEYRKKQFTVEVKALFANGEVAIARQAFDYPEIREAFTLSEDWTNLLGNPQHIGICKDTLRTPFSLAWTTNIGSNIYMTSPLIYQNKIYIASVDENAQGQSAVVALNASNGHICWKYSTHASVKNTIGITAGKVFAQDVEGHLYAINAESGKLEWEKQLDVLFIPGLEDGLVVENGIVYAGAGKGLCAIEATTGEMLWKNGTWEQREGTTATHSWGENILLGSVQWDALYANDARTGDLLWRIEENGIRHRASSPAIHNGIIYLASDRSLFALSLRSGDIIARKKLPYSVDVTSTPLVTKDEIILGTARNGIIALERTTWSEKWHFLTENSLLHTAPYVTPTASQIECSPILSGDLVLFGASDGAFYALDRTNGTLRWMHMVGAPILSSMSISGNLLVGVDYAGNIYAFKG